MPINKSITKKKFLIWLLGPLIVSGLLVAWRQISKPEPLAWKESVAVNNGKATLPERQIDLPKPLPLKSQEKSSSAQTEPPPPAQDEMPAKVLLEVPFQPQAPYAEWDDDRFQDGCEEAAVLMAMRWVKGLGLSKAEAKAEILKMAAYELEIFGEYRDTSAADTVKYLINGYFGYQKAEVIYDPSEDDLRRFLAQGKLILAPADGRALNNPYYVAPGPVEHMLVIRGYDLSRDEFITNDAGTRRGEEYRYKTFQLLLALRDYPTGNHLPIPERRRVIIVISK